MTEDLERAEETARRLLRVAALLAGAAVVILLVDFMIKRAIVQRAEEVNRVLVGATGPASGRTDRPGGEPLPDVAAPAAIDQGDGPGEDAAVGVG